MAKKTTRRDGGAGSIYQRKKDGKWIAALTLPPDPLTDKQRRKVKVAKTATEAKRKLAEMRRDRDNGVLLTTRSRTLTDYAEAEWLPMMAKQVKPKTWGGYESKWRLYIRPILGNRKLDLISPLDVEKIETRMTDDGLSGTSALAAFRVLSQIMSDAERQGLIARNPCEAARTPETTHKRFDSIPLEHIAKLIDANMDDPYLARYILALETSARKSEILGLELDRLDLTPGKEWCAFTWGLQRVNWAHGCTNSKPICGRRRAYDCPQREFKIPAKVEAEQILGGLWLLRPKSATSKRPIPLGSLSAEIMRSYFTQVPEPRRFVFEQDGQPIDPKEDYDRWKAMLKKAGLPDYPLHSLRHSTATFLNAAAVDANTRKTIMGHSSVDMTEHYTHRSVADSIPAITALDTLIRSALS